MTDNPIDMAIALVIKEMERVMFEGTPINNIQDFEYAFNELVLTRNDYLHIKKSDVPEDLPKVLKKYEKPEPCPIYSIVEAARLVAKALEAEDE